jgi:hypothetical protein
VTLWSGDYPKALEQFGYCSMRTSSSRPCGELRTAPRRPNADRGPGPPGCARIADRAQKESKDAAMLARLAWTLHQRKDMARAEALLDRAVA